MNMKDASGDVWSKLIESVGGNQGAKQLFPSDWLLKKMQPEIYIRDFVVGGENCGHLMWFPSEHRKMVSGIRNLFSAMDDLDEEIGLHEDTKRELAQAQAKIEELSQSPPPEKVASTHFEDVIADEATYPDLPPEALKAGDDVKKALGYDPPIFTHDPAVISNKKLTGAECYNMKATGKAWVDIGGSPAMRRAKSYANHHGKPWPVPSQKPATSAPDSR